MQKTVGLIVDIPYLYAAKNILGENIDYGAVMARAAELTGATVGPAIAHVRRIPGQGKFLSSLSSSGYNYFVRDWKSDDPRWVQEVARSIIELAPDVDELVLAVGDGRLASIVDFVADVWKIDVKAIGFREVTDDDIADAVSGFTELDKSICYRSKPQAATA